MKNEKIKCYDKLIKLCMYLVMLEKKDCYSILFPSPSLPFFTLFLSFVLFLSTYFPPFQSFTFFSFIFSYFLTIFHLFSFIISPEHFITYNQYRMFCRMTPDKIMNDVLSALKIEREKVESRKGMK